MVSCSLPLGTGLVGYPDLHDPDDPATTWTALGCVFPILDSYGHPLTWGNILSSHAFLVLHASCSSGRTGYASDSDGEDGDAPCPCQWHPAVEDELHASLVSCQRWPGPICGPCWGASCACGHVFTSHHDAAGRDEMDRLICKKWLLQSVLIMQFMFVEECCIVS